MYERIELAQKMEHDFPNLTFDDIAHYSMIPMPRGQFSNRFFSPGWVRLIALARRKRSCVFDGQRPQLVTPGTTSRPGSGSTMRHPCTVHVPQRCSSVSGRGKNPGVARTRAANRLIELLKQRAKTLVSKREGAPERKTLRSIPTADIKTGRLGSRSFRQIGVGRTVWGKEAFLEHSGVFLAKI